MLSAVAVAVNSVLVTTAYQIIVQQHLLFFMFCPNNPRRLLSRATQYHVNTHRTL